MNNRRIFIGVGTEGCTASQLPTSNISGNTPSAGTVFVNVYNIQEAEKDVTEVLVTAQSVTGNNSVTQGPNATVERIFGQTALNNINSGGGGSETFSQGNVSPFNTFVTGGWYRIIARVTNCFGSVNSANALWLQIT